MIKGIPINTNIKLIYSNKECGYLQVLDDLLNAKYVDIVTFDISLKKDDLLNKVKNLMPNIEVNIISNIPGRYYKYFYDSAKKAKKKIDAYMEKLNPDNFKPLTNIFFNFNNHSKIIMTNNIAYIGSANFSDESSLNNEMGVLIKEPEIINEIHNSIIQLLKRESIAYYGSSTSILNVKLNVHLTQLKTTIESIHENVFTFIDPPITGPTLEYFNMLTAFLSQTDYEALSELILSLSELKTDINRFELVNINDFKNLIEEIKQLLEYLEEFAQYDENEDSAEKESELREKSRDNIIELERKVIILMDMLKYIIENLSRLEWESKKIDNTN